MPDLHVPRAEWTACRYLRSRPCHGVTTPGAFPGSRTGVVRGGRMPASVTATHCCSMGRSGSGVACRLTLGACLYVQVRKNRLTLLKTAASLEAGESTDGDGDLHGLGRF